MRGPLEPVSEGFDPLPPQRKAERDAMFWDAMFWRRALVLAALCTSLFLGGCREEGTAEKAGRKVDEAVERLRHGDESTLEKAGRKVDEAVDDVGEAIEDLGEQIQGKD